MELGENPSIVQCTEEKTAELLKEAKPVASKIVENLE